MNILELHGGFAQVKERTKNYTIGSSEIEIAILHVQGSFKKCRETSLTFIRINTYKYMESTLRYVRQCGTPANVYIHIYCKYGSANIDSTS